MYEKYVKRVIDFTLALIALLVAWPIMIIVAILVRTKLGSSVIFQQPRPGKDEKVFKLYKFRTMTDERDSCGNLMPDSVRLTKFGKFLRSTSLDELPELINILKGDMSIVGPRPLLVDYLDLYTEEQKRRHEVRPGLTGWAMANGRNNLSWDEKFDLDIYYVNNISLWLDIKTVIKTAVIVLKRDGINNEGSATCERFTGSL